ncbi:MAG: DUF4873 domain-containing protein, partial [Gordonia amarae]
PGRVGLLTEEASREKHGERAYLGVARHGMPNYFLAADPTAAAHAAAVATALWKRKRTRVDVKPHLQAQFNRNVELGWHKLNPTLTTKPDLSDYRFTDAHERDEQDNEDDYCGPAVLTTEDGSSFEVKIHVIATYQPTEDTVRWYGRVLPSEAQKRAHQRLNQPATIQVGDHAPVAALLTDADPWGGSQITGAGDAPYVIPLVEELAEI